MASVLENKTSSAKTIRTNQDTDRVFNESNASSIASACEAASLITFYETFLSCIEYPGFRLSRTGAVLWSNSAAHRDLDMSLTVTIFDAIVESDQRALAELFEANPGTSVEHLYHSKVLTHSHSFEPVTLHLSFKPGGNNYCVITPNAVSARRFIGSKQLAILEGLSSLPLDSLIRPLAHCIRRWTQSELVVFLKEPSSSEFTLRILSYSFSSNVAYPKLILEYLQKKIPRAGIDAIARVAAESFGFKGFCTKSILYADSSARWGYILTFESVKSPFASVRDEIIAETVFTTERLLHLNQSVPAAAVLQADQPRAVEEPKRRTPLASSEASPLRDAELRRALTLLNEEKIRLISEKTQAENSASSHIALLANISHEIRTPLSGIAGVVSLLECTELSGDQKTYLNALARSVESMTRIVNDCFDLSGLKSESVKLKFERVSLIQLLKEICLNHRIKISEKGLRFFAQLPVFEDYTVNADRVRLRQVIDNLLTNALKFTSTGSITLELQKREQQVLINIKDTGRGISEANLENIFKRFFQEKNGAEATSNGLGLGLSISRQLIELMHGEISVQNNASGPGSTFSVSLPLESVVLRHASYAEPLQVSNVFVLVSHDEHFAKLLGVAQTEGVHFIHFAPKRAADYGLIQNHLNARHGEEVRYFLIFDNLTTTEEIACKNLFPPKTKSLRVAQNCFEDTNDQTVLYEPVTWDAIFSHTKQIPTVNERAGAESGSIEAYESLKPRSARKLNILVAEDDEVNQFVLKRFLQKLGFEVDLAANGREAFEIFLRDPQKHDAYLFDYMMPEIDGIQLAGMIRQFEREHLQAARTLIALTADAIKGREEKCLAAGFSVFLTKPVKLTKLREVLKETLTYAFDDEHGKQATTDQQKLTKARSLWVAS